MEAMRVAAIRIDRRAAAAAVFIGSQLDYTQVVHLPPILDKAESSVTGFLNWILASFGIESAAIESVDLSDQIRRFELTKTAVSVLRSASVPVWEVSKTELLSSFGYPVPRNRKEVRESVAQIWPMLNTRGTSHWVLDAVAIGLYVQTERLFLNQ